MGYTTTFEGSITIDPPLTPRMVERFNAYAEERHDTDGPTKYAVHCDWRVNDEGTEIAWNDAEKFYDGAAWMAWMIDRYVPANRDCNGEIKAEGEEPGDRWLLRVTHRAVTVHQAIDTYAEGGDPIDPKALGPDYSVTH